MLKFRLVKESKSTLNKRFFKQIIDCFFEILKNKINKILLNKNGEITFVLVDDEYIKILNNKYRNQNKATDVISFAYLEVSDFDKLEEDIPAGDIFISLDTAKRQAKEKKHSLKREVQILSIHGLLHCFGFDHRNDKEESEMEKWASKILEQIF